MITDHGEPAYMLQPLPRRAVASAPLPDYYARLRQRQPTGLSEAETRRLWEEERGDR